MEVTSLFGRGPVAIDTAIFVYFIEEHPSYLPRVEPVFRAIATGEIEATASALTLLETLVLPYRLQNFALARQYERILGRSRGLRLVPVASAVLRQAAKLRASLPLKTPDAIHLASAVSVGAKAFLTHDRQLPGIPGIRTIQLSELTGAVLG